MRLALLVLALAAALFVLDRLALWAESRGWIYYRRRRASPRALGNALLETQALLEPRAREKIEALAERPAEDEASGDPPPVRDDGTPRGNQGDDGTAAAKGKLGKRFTHRPDRRA